MAAVLARINRKRCVRIGTLQAILGLSVLGLVAVPISLGFFDGLIAAGLAAAAFFLWFGFFFFALAKRDPVALRMDEKGISGYYADPASWDEIASVHVFAGSRGHRFLGFELHDPIAFRDRQTPWRRYLSWSNGRAHQSHLTVPQFVLKDVEIETLAKIGADLHARHGTPPPRTMK